MILVLGSYLINKMVFFSSVVFSDNLLLINETSGFIDIVFLNPACLLYFRHGRYCQALAFGAKQA